MGLCASAHSNTVAPAPQTDASSSSSPKAGIDVASGGGGAAAQRSQTDASLNSGPASQEKLVYRVTAGEEEKGGSGNRKSMAGSQLMRTQYTEQRVKRTSTRKSLGALGEKMADLGPEYTPEARDRVIRAFRANPLFTHLSEVVLQAVYEEMLPLTVDAQTLIFSEGEEANMFYVVDQGLFAAGDAEGVKLEEFKQGDSIGEEALLAKVRPWDSGCCVLSSWL